MPALIDLPDDVLLLVLTSLESARDLRGLALSCRRLHELIEREGWRTFVRSSFPSLTIPPTSADAWGRMAESLTWQSRCWDHRSLRFNALLPEHGPLRRHRKSAAAFQPIVDAHLCAETGEELVVWGAGENIVARYRRRNLARDSTKTSWRRSDGDRFGYVPGYDDVRALAIVDRPQQGWPEILAGRDNGDLCLLSAQPDQFGERLASFSPSHAEGAISASQTGEAVAQSTIASLDVQDGLVAASTKESVVLYRLPQDDDPTNVAPLEIYNLGAEASEQKNVTLGSAKWMGSKELMAVALRGSKEPLRYLTLTPHGWSSSVGVKNADIEQQFGIGYGNICPNSLQPVKPHANTKGETSLLLSAWRDGTCRLQDLRTPSPFDAIYQDNIHPWAEMEALMTYGTERFVGGDMHGATVKVFDFRWTKGYYHTSGLPCGNFRPFPPPPQPFASLPEDTTKLRACCDHLGGFRCRWHELSRDIYYRPNATFFFSQSLPPDHQHARVWSLAKASDVSPGFYVGVSGGIVEANLEPTGDGAAASGGSGSGSDPNFGFGDWRSSSAHCGYEPRYLRVTMMETGDGLASPMNLRTIRLPPIYSGSRVSRPSRLQDVDGTLRRQHRLDSRFQNDEDFRGIEQRAD